MLSLKKEYLKHYKLLDAETEKFVPTSHETLKTKIELIKLMIEILEKYSKLS